PEHGSVERLPADPRRRFRKYVGNGGAPGERLAEQRRVALLEAVQADLVRPARLEPALDQCCGPSGEPLEDRHVRDCRLALADARREAQTRARMAPVRRADRRLVRHADGDGAIASLDGVRLELCLEAL